MPEMFLTEGRRDGEYLVGGKTLHLVTTESRWADATLTMQSGTPIAVRASDKAIVVWDDTQAAGSGNEVFYGFLYTSTYANPTGTLTPVTVNKCGPQAISTSWGRVPFLGDITRAKLTAAAVAKGFTIYD